MGILCPWCAWPFSLNVAEHREGCPATAPKPLLAELVACDRDCQSPAVCGIDPGTWPACSCQVKLREAA